jgi:tetratricopeptide (TPR) repeat protein
MYSFCYLRIVRRAREATPVRSTPEDHLRKAVAARTAATRAKYARLGLATRSPLDRTTQALLLRQLYLAHYEARRFRQAHEVATQMITLDVLPDVAHQDAARACQALGDFDRAAGHLRLAARRGPPVRRAFHLWTLGSLLYLAGRHLEAIGALGRAARWGTSDKPLYRAHLALVRQASGERVRNLHRLIDRLAAAPSGQGYGRFVLGRLCAYAGRRDEAIRHLESFVRRTTTLRPALAIALEGELEEAGRVLAELRHN